MHGLEKINNPVHPRSRGERPSVVDQVGSMHGSSPLARGTGRPDRIRPADDRFIPARAGNGRSSSSNRCLPTVHPRSRGERNEPGHCHAATRGSSPLARGTVPAPEPTARNERFIPARAGNGFSRPLDQAKSAVHPRSRGERFSLIFLRRFSSGSSPLARGTVDSLTDCAVKVRFIPARAGNGDPMKGSSAVSPVHPRSRGERRTAGVRDRMSDGSSPLARGTAGRPETGRSPGRFIPARAGNGHRHRRHSGASPVHPRSRGERFPDDGVKDHVAGSSPLARGTAAAGDRTEGRERFIPARAGNGGRTPAPAGRRSVHPRSRGERLAGAERIGDPVGSSPLARGTVFV